MKRIFCKLRLFLAVASGGAGALRSIDQEFSARKAGALIPLAALLLLVTGCNQDEAKRDAEEGKEEEVVAFNAKFGLAVPKKTADFIGLKIVEVEERLVPSTNQFSAQVYARRNGVALATASLDTNVLESVRDRTALAAGTDDGQIFQALVRKVTALSGNGISEVLLEIEDAGKALKAADDLSVRIANCTEKAVVSIPRNALLKTIEGNFVYTVSGERLVRTAVKIGTANDAFVEITDGLYSGDQVAVQPVMTLWLAELQSLRGGKACADGH